MKPPKHEVHGVYYAITRWKYYLQGLGIVVHNVHNPLHKFLNEKNANNKVNFWSLEIAIYNITFEWISSAHNKAADCLSRLVDVRMQQLPASSLTQSQHHQQMDMLLTLSKKNQSFS